MIEILLHDCTGLATLNESMLKIEDEIFNKTKKSCSLLECHLKVREAWAKYCKENAVLFQPGEGDKAKDYLKNNPNTVAKIELLDHDCYILYDYVFDTLDYFVIEQVDTSKHWTIENFDTLGEECIRYVEQNCNSYNYVALL